MSSFSVANGEWFIAGEPCVVQWISFFSIRYWVASNCSTQIVSVWMTGTVFSITCVLYDWNAAIFHIIVISFIPHFLITVKYIRNCSVLTLQWITEWGMCGCTRRNRTFVAYNWMTWRRGRSIQNVLIFQSNGRYIAAFWPLNHSSLLNIVTVLCWLCQLLRPRWNICKLCGDEV